jgi:tryptophan halogenase
MRGLLIEGVMKAGYDDWRHFLPCDSALAVPSQRVGALTPYTMSTAHGAGWQWRIPLQHRTGNGHVYCSGFTTDEEAARVLVGTLDTPALAEPRPIRFVTGRRRRSWVKNVVAIGLSAGFLEPLESTSIQLIMNGVGELIQHFPDRGFHPSLADEFNRRMSRQYESVRDFIVMHYKLTQRTDTEFWKHCAAMPIPEALQHQIELFKSSGQVAILDPDGFLEPSWVSLFMGLGLRPQSRDRFVDQVDEENLRTHFLRHRAAIAQTADRMPDHGAYIEHQVKADPVTPERLRA